MILNRGQACNPGKFLAETCRIEACRPVAHTGNGSYWKNFHYIYCFQKVEFHKVDLSDKKIKREALCQIAH